MRSFEAFLLAEPPKPELVAVCGNAESRPCLASGYHQPRGLVSSGFPQLPFSRGDFFPLAFYGQKRCGCARKTNKRANSGRGEPGPQPLQPGSVQIPGSPRGVPGWKLGALPAPLTCCHRGLRGSPEPAGVQSWRKGCRPEDPVTSSNSGIPSRSQSTPLP